MYVCVCVRERDGGREKTKKETYFFLVCVCVSGKTRQRLCVCLCYICVDVMNDVSVAGTDRSVYVDEDLRNYSAAVWGESVFICVRVCVYMCL